MNQKGLITIVWIIVVVVIVGTVGYLTLTKQQTPSPVPTQQNRSADSTSAQPSQGQTDEFRIHSLDVSNITYRGSGLYQPVTGNLIISHNAVAIFPLDLDSQSKKLTEISPTTIFEVQTKSGCWDQEISENDAFMRNIINESEPLQTKNVGDVRKIILEMPYRASQDNYTRVPAAFCVGFHTSDNRWVWSTAPIKPVLDDNLKQGRGEIELDAKNVDGIAILFDTTTVIETITFEASKIR